MRLPDDRPWHALRAAELPGAASSDPTSGLTRFEAARRLERSGPNALPQPPRPTWVSILLQRRIAQFGRYLIAASAVLFVLVVAVGLMRAVPPAQIVMVAISQVVGLIPEGLPVSLTIALAVGVQRMAHRRAVVRRLSAVETLGCTTLICTDKTGTLTRNELTVTAIYLPGGRALEVTGTGYGPEGRLLEAGLPLSADAEEALRELLEASVLCNDATRPTRTRPIPAGGRSAIRRKQPCSRPRPKPGPSRRRYARASLGTRRSPSRPQRS